MTRRHVTFDCECAALVGTIDDAAGTTGLLIVSGGNEVRAGAWSGQAQLAARIAAEGFPVLRFDRRGVGDSGGANGEFRSSGPDITAAIAAFRAQCPQLSRIVGHGNCDGASALMLSGGAGCDALVLSNPWTIEDDSAPAPPEVLRDHYRRRLLDRSALKRLLTGQVSLGKVFASLKDAARSADPPSGLAAELVQAIRRFKGPVMLPLAARDRTAQAFLAAWNRKDPRIRICADATHSFVEPHARAWLAEQVLDVLRD